MLLVLSLLGFYLVDHCKGDVRQLPADLAPSASETKYDRVSRVLRRYDQVLTAADREFLEGFSALRLPMPRTASTLLLANSAADETTAGAIVKRLVTYRILRYNPDTATYTTHPLIRNHYLHRLKQNRDRAVALHRQIADFYLTTAGDMPSFPTLADLTPLIEAVHHCCQAGDYDEADKIRREHIYQGDHFVLTSQLGAYDTALTLMQEFFPEGDITQSPQVSDLDKQSWIFNEIGRCLMKLGRLKEAPPFFEKGTEADIQLKDWNNASMSYQNLAELHIYLGNLSASASAAENALSYARRIKNYQYEQYCLEWQGWVDHLLGHLDVATAAFKKAEAIFREQSGKTYLNRESGVQYAEHLRHQGDTDYARRITEANRIICEQNCWQEELSLCHRLLGDLDAAADSPHDARAHYTEALRLARSISRKDVLIEALLARGRWAAQQGDVAAAASDLEEALGNAIEGSYRLHEADIRVALAWMHQRIGNRDAARQEAARAQQMSQSMGYYWGQQDVAEVLAVLGIDQAVG